ncbi:MAG: hypothetical protein RL199_2363, partial [Pseudomonadota bacterium]
MASAPAGVPVGRAGAVMRLCRAVAPMIALFAVLTIFVFPGTACAAPTCPPGQVLSVGTCRPCDAGTWSLGGTATTCRPWLTCPPGRFVKVGGTATSNRLCQSCPAGTFTTAANEDACVPWRRCAPGEFVSAKGSTSADRTCAVCPEGRYTATANASACAAWAGCPAGTYVSGGTRMSDRTCHPCGFGTFSKAANVPACAPWTTCGNGSFEAAPPSASMDRVCTAVTTCPASQYVFRPATATSDRRCAKVTTCSSTQYETAAPTATSDRACDNLTVCGSFQFESTPATKTSDRTCSGLTTCTSTQFQSKGPTKTTDRVCSNLTVCKAHEYQSTAPTPSSDRRCLPAPATGCPSGRYREGTACRDCPSGLVCLGNAAQPKVPAACGPGWFKVADATSTTDNLCHRVTVCGAAEFEAVAPTATTDRVCRALTLCGPEQFASRAATKTSDRSCTDLTRCGSDEFQSAAPTATRNRQCTKLTECAPGQFVSVRPTPSTSGPLTNRRCSRCPAGKTTTVVNADRCGVAPAAPVISSVTASGAELAAPFRTRFDAMVSGTAPQGSLVRLGTVGLGTAFGPPAIVGSDGQWSVTLSEAGTYAYEAYALSPEGTASAGSGVRTLVIDRSTSIDGVVLSAESISGSPTPTGQQVTSRSDWTFTGTAEAGGFVTARQGDVTLATTTLGLDTNDFSLSVAFDVNEADGDKDITLTATDAVGNTASTVVTVRLDRTPPLDGTVTVAAGDGLLVVTWTNATDAVTGVASYLVASRAGATPPEDCSAGEPATSPFPGEPLQPGVLVSYRVCSVDIAGNVSSGATASGRVNCESGSHVDVAENVCVPDLCLAACPVGRYALNDVDCVTRFRSVRGLCSYCEGGDCPDGVGVESATACATRFRDGEGRCASCSGGECPLGARVSAASDCGSRFISPQGFCSLCAEEHPEGGACALGVFVGTRAGDAAYCGSLSADAEGHCAACSTSVPSTAERLGLPRAAYGVWDRSGYLSTTQFPYLRGQAYLETWAAMNPARDTFSWAELDRQLQFADSQNQFFSIQISPVGGPAGSGVPRWLFDEGVPEVTDG